ncbi:hypothetical protein PG996_006209 [Apiospora saccharicola]|uniref:Rhodopsin domain-containing protein n=1 Tax=Apiospora saccharicola TaxID=335842 RepID=A0ABR1VRD9_9PEZI
MADTLDDPMYLPVLPIVRDHLVIECVIIGIALAILVLRVVSRVQNLGVGADDYLTVVGFELFVTTLFYITCLAILKLGVLCFYRRIFGGTAWMRAATYAMVAVVGSWWFALLLVVIFDCAPVQKQWDPFMAEGECINLFNVNRAIAATNIATDVAIMGLPLRLIWSLRIRTLEKVVVMCCFALGTGVCAISVVRIVHLSDLRRKADVAGNSEEAIFLGVLEQNIAVISISLLSLRPLYARWRSSTSRYHHRPGRRPTPPSPSPSDAMPPPPVGRKPSRSNDDTLVGSYRGRAAESPSHGDVGSRPGSRHLPSVEGPNIDVNAA